MHGSESLTGLGQNGVLKLHCVCLGTAGDFDNPHICGVSLGLRPGWC